MWGFGDRRAEEGLGEQGSKMFLAALCASALRVFPAKLVNFVKWPKKATKPLNL